MNELWRKNIDKVINIYSPNTNDYLGNFFYLLYEVVPCCYSIYFNKNELSYIEMNLMNKKIINNIKKTIDCRKIIENFKTKDDFTVYMIDAYGYFILGDKVPFLLTVNTSNSEEITDTDVFIWCDKKDVNDIFEQIKDCFEAAPAEKICTFGIAAMSSGGSIYTSYYDYSPKKIDIKKNYNDDFKPAYDKICKVINKENETGLILLYGEPGTGKSSVIKNLIGKYPDIEFIFVDDAILCHAQQNTLISYFIENENCVFILEDCEKSLMSREEAFNPIINTLLNITDGIIGDVLGIKLICTFNTSLSKIDKALLRKGRLSLKYEFKKLKADKVSKILKRDTKEDMTLADIYNINEENDFSKPEKRKIGF